MEINFEPSVKQMQLFESFDDKEVTEVLYGGAASGGKSYGLMALATIKALQYDGIKILVGREELKNLKETTLNTLFEKVFPDFGIKKDFHFNYNQTSGIITFFNGSSIIARPLKYEPSDPNVNSLGSLEITFAIIDEAPEVVEKVIKILHSRCGRWLNKQYKIKPMLFMTCNPSRGYCYNEFYRPAQKNELKSYRKFIPATIDDNKFMGDEYKKHLLTTLDFNDKQRLLYGKWEFDNDPNALIKFDNINAAYDYDKPTKLEGDKFITADIAFTSDKCILIRWVGMAVVEIREVIKDKERPEDVINQMKKEHGVRNSNIAYDATGAGMYLKNYLPNSYIFHSGGKPVGGKIKEFEHLKTQCYFLLANEIMKTDSSFRIFDTKLKEELIDEVLQIKTLPKEKIDAQIKMIKKDDIKKTIGRSPDILDALAMRFVYTVKTKYKRNF